MGLFGRDELAWDEMATSQWAGSAVPRAVRLGQDGRLGRKNGYSVTLRTSSECVSKIADLLAGPAHLPKVVRRLEPMVMQNSESACMAAVIVSGIWHQDRVTRAAE
jgi:hypothetical protein